MPNSNAPYTVAVLQHTNMLSKLQESIILQLNATHRLDVMMSVCGVLSLDVPDLGVTGQEPIRAQIASRVRQMVHPDTMSADEVLAEVAILARISQILKSGRPGLGHEEQVMQRLAELTNLSHTAVPPLLN